ncbi:MAG: dicarboxylate/amino acid:cation symporter [Eubacterium sp.]|nr:dicarboxylate/amino acid:cation symporter [Eubacterium sp.]
MKKLTKIVPIEDENFLTECMTFIGDSLRQMRLSKKLIVGAELLAEEVIVGLSKNGPENPDESRDMNIRLEIKKRMGDIVVSISAPGRELDMKQLQTIDTDLFDDEKNDPETERAIRSIILNANKDKLKYSHDTGYNYFSIAVGKTERSSLITTLIAMVAGLLVGMIASALFSENVTDGMVTYALSPVKTMFMNALSIIVGPVVFFSIVTCLSQFKDLKELGRIGIKVMSMYFITTVLAVGVSILFSLIIQPGEWGGAVGKVATDAVSVNTDMDTSILSTIINIVPNNLVQPFLKSDTLQLIFLAVICGIAVGMIGKYSKMLSNLFDACNHLFLMITTIFARFLPVAVFCSTAMLMIQVGGKALIQQLSVFGTFLLSVTSMMVIYGLLLTVLGRVNPFKFFAKAKEGMLTSLALSSSSAAMPTNMNICTKKLGISPKLASFSIPLGATINMDGTSIFLIVFAMFLARMYGVDVTGSALMTMSVTVIMLSMGCPGVPGAALVCLGIVLENIGVPMEAIGLIMGITPLADMTSTMNNVTGDMAVSTIVARSEGLLDKKVFYSKN